MIRKRDASPHQPVVPTQVHGTQGAIAAGRDVTNSVTQYVEAEQAFVLSPDAHGPIPADAPGRGVSNIPATSETFVGRASELTALEEAFTGLGEVLVQAVHGLGGVGKSALAAQWAAGRHETVRWWITANTAPSIDSSVAALARALQPGLASLPDEVQAERAIRWLADHPEQWLLVLDNVEAPAHIRPLLDRIAGGRVLVTTRLASGWHRHAAVVVRLGVLEPADSVDLFTRILTQHEPRDHTGADAVCEELGYLALAVEQAAAYCAETGISPDAYLDRLASWPKEMYAAAAEGGDSGRTCARIWRLTLDRIDTTPLAGDLLRLLAWYAPDRIPRDLLAPLGTPPEVDTAIGKLAAYNMITDNRDGTLTVHRLVQALARTPDPGDPHRQNANINQARDNATAFLVMAYPADHEDPANWPRYQALLPHTDALTSHHPADQDTSNTAVVLDRAAAYRQGQGTPALALPAFQRALEACERVRGQHHEHTLSTRSNLASAYAAAGNQAQAISLSEAALADTERVLGKDHPYTLTARNNLAHTYTNAGDPRRAIPLYEETLTVRQQVLDKDHTDTLTTLNNLAGAYESMGDLDRSIPMLKAVLAGFERVLGKEHPKTLTARGNLAYAYETAGDRTRAIPLYEETLAARQQVLGKDHPSTLTALNNLASAYEAAGDVDRSIPLLEAVLSDFERVLGRDHPHTFISYSNLVSAYVSAGRLNPAIPLAEAALAGFERVLGENHLHTLNARSNLATLYGLKGDIRRAVSMYLATLAACERVLSQGHPFTEQVRSNLEHARSQSQGEL
ncbi:tetratricopeptide repeat protein [Streptomyces gardneri]|uniref:tetratricopeptide repeat protein n=1 Tax=Streptomyces gardneri TaxID=66892 RepID=UPI0036A3BDFC